MRSSATSGSVRESADACNALVEFMKLPSGCFLIVKTIRFSSNQRLSRINSSKYYTRLIQITDNFLDLNLHVCAFRDERSSELESQEHIELFYTSKETFNQLSSSKNVYGRSDPSQIMLNSSFSFATCKPIIEQFFFHPLHCWGFDCHA